MDALLRSFRTGRSDEVSVTWASGRTETVVAPIGRVVLLRLAESTQGCEVAAWVFRSANKVALTAQYKQADGAEYGGTNTVEDEASTIKVYADTGAIEDNGLSGCTEWPV